MICQVISLLVAENKAKSFANHAQENQRTQDDESSE